MIGLVGIGADAQLRDVVGPVHQSANVDRPSTFRASGVLSISTCMISLGLVSIWPAEDFAGEAVDARSQSPSLSTLPPTVTGRFVVVDVQSIAADDADLAHLPADQRGMRAGAAERGQDASAAIMPRSLRGWFRGGPE